MFEHLNHTFPFADERLQAFAHHFKRLEVPAHTVLLGEGQVAKTAYWIAQGCIRVWFNKNGKDITCQVFFEGSTVASIESFRKGIPSLVSMETLEPCTLWYAHKADVARMTDAICDDPGLRRLFIDAVFQRTFDYMSYFFSAIKDSPQERYLALLAHQPQLILRIPQHYIASYLGISTVHLSRIKSRLAKGNK